MEQVKVGKITLGELGRGGVEIESELVPEVKIETPYLQLVMTRLWNKECHPDGSYRLRLETLTGLGGAIKIVEDHFQEHIRLLSEKEQEAAARIFEYLVTPAGSKIAYPVLDLTKQTGLDAKQLKKLLEKLSSSEFRLLHALGPSPDKPGVQRYEIFHDVVALAILNWRRQHLNKVNLSRLKRRLLVWISVVAVVILSITFFVRWSYEYQRTEGMIARLKELSLRQPKEAKASAESILDHVANYLWQKGGEQSLDKLLKLLRESDEFITEDYGFDPWVAFVMPSVDQKRDWPLAIRYNPSKKLDQGKLLYWWRRMAPNISEKWGVVVPMGLKLELDDALPVDEIVAIVQHPKKDTSDTRTEESKLESKLVFPARPLSVIITEKEMTPRLKLFFEKHKEQWTELKELKYRGPWWLVPRWTIPLWKAARHQALTREAAIAIALFDHLGENSELVITRDTTNYLLERVRQNGYPKTVEEALAARGGLEGLQQDLRELVRQDISLYGLEYLLDALANYPLPYYQPSEAAELASYEVYDLRLQGLFYYPYLTEPRPAKSIDEETKLISKWDFDTIYGETGKWLSVERPIRVYIGAKLLESFVTPDDKLKPEVVEALEELRGDLYNRFGISAPGASFRDYTGDRELPEDALRIEIVKQTSDNDDAKPIGDIAPEQALERLKKELGRRYLGWRTWWLTAEKVNWLLLYDLPKDLRDWLLNNYTLTDLKQILRLVIAPTDKEIDIYTTGGYTEQALKEIAPEQSLRHPEWLLASLIFWVNAEDPLDANEIAKSLQATKRERLKPTQASVPGGKVTGLVQEGISALEKQNFKSAEGLFKEALKLDRKIAKEAFLILYPLQQRMSVTGQLRQLEARCSPLPDPGEFSNASVINIPTPYEIEDFLEQYSKKISSAERRGLELCLLANYVQENYPQKARTLFNELIKNRQEETWSANEEYQ